MQWHHDKCWTGVCFLRSLFGLALGFGFVLIVCVFWMIPKGKLQINVFLCYLVCTLSPSNGLADLLGDLLGVAWLKFLSSFSSLWKSFSSWYFSQRGTMIKAQHILAFSSLLLDGCWGQCRANQIWKVILFEFSKNLLDCDYITLKSFQLQS